MTALIFRPFAARAVQAHPMGQTQAWGGVGVLDWPCIGDKDYAEGLRMVWPLRCPVLVLEHDLAPTLAQAAELLDCPRNFCVPMYRIYPPTTCLPEPVWAHRTQDEDGKPQWIPEWQEWVPLVGLGMAKISPARQAYSPPPLVNWSFLDTALSKHLGVDWHVHNFEVPHLHR